jgi:hypothetical protein
MSKHQSAVVTGIVAACFGATVWAAQGAQGAALPTGKAVSGSATTEAPAVYQFNATSAGVLTIALNGTGDLAIMVSDADGQPVPQGQTDQDLFGSTGTEQLMVTITEAGRYKIEIRQQDSGPSKFEIGAAWVAFPAFARPADPDTRPSQARALETGRTHEDSLDPATGDQWDWFVFTPKLGGALTVILRPAAGAGNDLDLVLELYVGENLTEAVSKSDQDMQDNMANESATIDVKPGQKVYLKVVGNGSSAGKYRVSSSLIQ